MKPEVHKKTTRADKRACAVAGGELQLDVETRWNHHEKTPANKGMELFNIRSKGLLCALV